MTALIRSSLCFLTLSLCATPALASVQHKKIHHKKAVATSPAVSRTVKEFSSINISGAFQTTVNNNQPQQLLIHATAAEAQCVVTNVNDGTLYIQQRSSAHCRTTKRMSLTINTPNLKGIMTQGDNSTTVNKLDTQTFLSYAGGDSHLNLNGKTRSLNSVISGEASVDAQKFTAKYALISASGNSEMQLQTQDSLFVSASGNATIRYSGNPKQLTKSLSGTSSVEHSLTTDTTIPGGN